METKKGILVVITGIPNIGKSFQRDLAVRWLKSIILEKQATKVKYPVRHVTPTGTKILDYLYNDNPKRLSPVDFQLENVFNKSNYEPTLVELLKKNDVVIVENYTGTSIAYGMLDGIDKSVLINMNEGLLAADVTILLDGKSFRGNPSKRKNVYEKDHQKMKQLRLIHRDLAKEFRWKIVNANRPVQRIHEDVKSIISEAMKNHEEVLKADKNVLALA